VGAPAHSGPLQHINVWLVPGDRGWILVDTGMAYASVIAAWEELDQALPLSRDLERVVVTHHHPDHIGMAARLAERYGVPVHATPQALAATSRMLDRDDPQRPVDVETFADQHGFELDADMRQQLEWRSYADVVSGVPAAGPHCRRPAADDPPDGVADFRARRPCARARVPVLGAALGVDLG